MPRKEGSVDEIRKKIKREYKRGRKVERKITSEQALTAFERDVKREVACYLKAQDFSYNYIGDTLGLSREVVKKWFQEDEMKAKVAKIQADFLDGAVKLMKSYAIEIVEIFMEIVRQSNNDETAIKAGVELLDRMGLSKVNKSESIAAITRKDEIDITDTTGLLERAKSAPPETQAAMARKMEELVAIAQEHAEPAEVDSA